MNIFNPVTVTIDKEEYNVYQIRSDKNGNPRFVIHYLAFDIKDYDSINIYGFKKYRGKAFGGGIVFSSYDLEEQIKYMVDTVKEVNQKKNNLK